MLLKLGDLGVREPALPGGIARGFSKSLDSGDNPIAGAGGHGGTQDQETEKVAARGEWV